MEEFNDVIKCDVCGEYGLCDEHICTPQGIENMERQKSLALVKKMEGKFTIPVIRKLIVDIYREQISFAEKEIEKVFENYDELCAKGVSFQDRVKMVNVGRAEFLRKHIEVLKLRSQKFEVIPLQDWIYYGDYEKMKRDGFKSFLHFWFSLSHKF